MAIKDVRNYYFNMLAQYLEEKQNLADFEVALKDGHITEEQMSEAYETVSKLEENYHRLSYIMFLLDMPNRPKKKLRYISQNKTLIDEFKRLNADMAAVEDDNVNALKMFKLKLKELKDNENKDPS